MNQPRGHVLIGIASNRHAPDEVHDAIEAAQFGLGQMGYLSTRVKFGSSDLEDARNTIVSQFYVTQQYSHAILLDDDVHFAPGTIERLMSHPVDFVLGAYRLKQGTEKYPVRKLPGPMTCVDPSTGKPHLHGLIKIGGGPGGLMRITRNVIERLVTAAPDDWYHQKKVTGGKAWRFFEFDVIDHERISEDMNFCRKWRAIGGDIWCDPHITTHHMGMTSFSGNFAEHLKREGWLSDPEKVQKISLAANLPSAVGAESQIT